MTAITAYAGLFFTAFLAATIFPVQSEAVLVGLVLSEKYSLPLLLLAASVGNILGSAVTYVMGLWIDRLHDKPWFPVKPAMRERAQAWYHRYGKWSLLLSWVPFIGDPLTLAAGMMRERFWVFLLLVSIAKIGRYLAVLATVGLVIK